ncbi:ATP-binding cassette domain-containing protein [Pseudonocardia endophytica]|uniref:ATP-binding cassette domain-containing protein n=1 Tax=Pseudonocardia endophytica TaxID=401976 RepID=UPI001404BF10|nr:ATP-binding cassette domain-containing protein [Pseudonocardia endophytica]
MSRAQPAPEEPPEPAGGPPVDPRLLRVASAVRGHLVVSVVCGAALTGLILLQAWLIARVVAGATDGADLTTLAPLVALVAGVAVARAVLAYGSESAALASAARAKSQLRMRLVRHLASRPPDPDGPGAGELVTLATRGLDALDDYIARYLPQLVLAVIVPVAVLVVITDADWISGAVVAVTLPLIPLFMALVGMHTRSRTRRQWRMLARLGGHFLDVVQGLPTLLLFRRAAAVAEKVRETTDAHRRATMGTLRIAFLSAFVLEVLATLAVALVAVEVGLRLLSGNLDLGTALLVLILAPEAYLPLREVGARFHASMEGVAAARQVFDVLDGPRSSAADAPDAPDAPDAGWSTVRPSRRTMIGGSDRIRAEDSLDPDSTADHPRAAGPMIDGSARVGATHGTDPHPTGDHATAPTSEIDGSARRRAVHGTDPHRTGDHAGTTLDLDGLVVRHPGREDAALDDLSLHVAAGESVLVRGCSGAGKSTLLAVLLGFVEAEAGSVRADGADVRGLAPDAWRRRIAWVPQHPHLFAWSLADNIALGEPDAARSDIERAAGRAGLDAVAAALPDGYDTPLGENGTRLSSGERQRVALARAFLRDAPLVLLDEPTAHLDPDTAAAVRSSAAELLRGRTALVVAHDDGWGDLTGRTVELRDGQVANERHTCAAGTEPHARTVRRALAGADAATEPGPSPDPANERDTRTDGADERHVRAGGVGSRTRAELSWTTGAEPHGREVRAALAPVLRPRSRQILAGALLGAAATACGAGLLSLAAWLIATAATQPPITAVAVAVVLTRALGVGRGVARYAERLVGHDAALRALADVRARVYARLAATGPVRRLRTGDLVSRLVSDTESVQDVVVRGVVPVAAAAVAGSGAVILAGALFLPGGLLLAAGLVLAGVGVPALAAATGRGPAARAARDRAGLSTALVDTLHGAPDLIAYGAMDRSVDAVADADARLTRCARRDARVLGLGAGASALVAGLTLAGALLLGVGAVAGGTLGAIPMTVLVLTTLAAFEIVAPLPGLAARAGATRAGARRVASVLATPARRATAPRPDRAVSVPNAATPATPSGGDPDPGDATHRPAGPGSHDIRTPDCRRTGRGGAHAVAPTPLPTGGDLRIRGLTVAYPGGPPVLDALDLDLPAGARLALVGPSGAGKSTLAGVLFGFLEPGAVRAGSVTLDGVELLGRDPDEVRAVVSGVPQDPHVFDSTVRENLRLARPDATDAELRDVLDRVGLDRLHLEELVGTHGRRLSGGMHRRVAVARALLADPAVLVLDEPTAHLDPDTRDAVLDDVLGATAGRSVLLITHDPACLDRVDAVHRLAPVTRG